MKLGEVVRFQKKRWRVHSHSQEFHTCVLASFDGEKVEVADDLDQGLELKVLYNPSDWPFVSIPVKQTFGRIMKVTRARLDLSGEGTSETLTLEPMVDWIPGDFVRGGGSIFFNPKLGLKSGEVLVAVHQNGKTQRLPITRGFGSIKTRAKRVAEPEKPSNNYQRILQDDVFGEKD